MTEDLVENDPARWMERIIALRDAGRGRKTRNANWHGCASVTPTRKCHRTRCGEPEPLNSWTGSTAERTENFRAFLRALRVLCGEMAIRPFGACGLVRAVSNELILALRRWRSSHAGSRR